MESLPDDEAADLIQLCTISQAVVEGITVVVVSGTVDALTAPSVQQAVDAAVQTAPSALIVDFADVDFLASAGMTVLVVAAEDMAKRGRFAVVADGPATSRPITLVGLTEVFPLFQSRDEAIEELRG